jgi:hypothetical protein
MAQIGGVFAPLKAASVLSALWLRRVFTLGPDLQLLILTLQIANCALLPN